MISNAMLRRLKRRVSFLRKEQLKIYFKSVFILVSYGLDKTYPNKIS